MVKAESMVKARATLLTLFCCGMLLPGFLNASDALDSENERIFPTDFAFGQHISIDSNSSIYRFEIELDVYKYSVHPDLSDVRVFNANQDMVPVKVAFNGNDSRISSEEKSVVLKFRPIGKSLKIGHEISGFKLKYKGLDIEIDHEKSGKPKEFKGSIVYIVDHTKAFKEKRRTEELVIDFTVMKADESFISLVKVVGSNDLQSWSLIHPKATIAKIPLEGSEILKNIVPMNGSNYRFYKLEFSGEDQQIKILGIKEVVQPTLRYVEKKRQTLEIQGKKFRIEKGTKKNPTIEGGIGFDIGGRFPVDRILVRAPKNGVYHYEIEAANDLKGPWRLQKSGLAYQMIKDGIEIQNERTKLSGQRFRYWRLKSKDGISSFGSVGLKVQIGWVSESIVFLATGPTPFQLVYGRAVETGSSNVTLLNKSIQLAGFKKTSDIPVAKLGKPTSIGGPDKLIPPLQRTEIPWKTYGLWLALLGGVGMLFLMVKSQLKSVAVND